MVIIGSLFAAGYGQTQIPLTSLSGFFCQCHRQDYTHQSPPLVRAKHGTKAPLWRRLYIFFFIFFKACVCVHSRHLPVGRVTALHLHLHLHKNLCVLAQPSPIHAEGEGKGEGSTSTSSSVKKHVCVCAARAAQKYREADLKPASVMLAAPVILVWTGGKFMGFIYFSTLYHRHSRGEHRSRRCCALPTSLWVERGTALALNAPRASAASNPAPFRATQRRWVPAFAGTTGVISVENNHFWPAGS